MRTAPGAGVMGFWALGWVWLGGYLHRAASAPTTQSARQVTWMPSRSCSSAGHPNRERELYLLGFSGYKREKLTSVNLSKHLTEGKVEEAIFGADGNQHSSGDVTSEAVRCPHQEACASSVLSPSNTLLGRDRPHQDCMQWAKGGSPEDRVQIEGRQCPRMFALSASAQLSGSLSCTGWAVSLGPCQPFLQHQLVILSPCLGVYAWDFLVSWATLTWFLFVWHFASMGPGFSPNLVPETGPLACLGGEIRQGSQEI